MLRNAFSDFKFINIKYKMNKYNKFNMYGSWIRKSEKIILIFIFILNNIYIYIIKCIK